MIGELDSLSVGERVVLQKFEGDPVPENEFERLTIQDGKVISHEVIENGKVTGPVFDGNLTGTSVGKLMVKEV